MRTPKNILQHELIGLECEIVKSKNPYNTGIKGKIIDETMKSVVIRSGGEEKRIMKAGTVFRVSLERQRVDIDGDYLAARPEDRIKKKFRKW